MIEKILIFVVFILCIILIYGYFLKNKKEVVNENENNNDNDNNKEIKKIFLFYAPWCRYSNMFLPIWEYVKDNNKYDKYIIFEKINVDEYKNLASLHDITKLPTVKNHNNEYFNISFKKKNEVLERELQEFINS